jgi:hypothetical protein
LRFGEWQRFWYTAPARLNLALGCAAQFGVLDAARYLQSGWLVGGSL